MVRFFAFIGLLFFAGGSPQFVSITSHPIPLPPLASGAGTRPLGMEKNNDPRPPGGPWRRMWKWNGITRLGQSHSGEIISTFADLLEGGEFPLLAVWSDAIERKQGNISITKEMTWLGILDHLSGWAGPYTATPHQGFLEVAWSDPARVTALRKDFQRSVPPIYLMGDPLHLLQLWHEISGEDFSVDRRFLSGQSPWAKYKARHQGAPTQVIMYADRVASPDDFIKGLAKNLGGAAWRKSGRWVLGFYQDAPNDAIKIEALMDCIDDEFVWISETQRPGDDLAAFGVKALPAFRELWTQSVNKDDPRYDVKFAPYAALMAKISDPARDDACIRMFEEYAQHADRSDHLKSYVTLLDALAADGRRQAIPAIRQLRDRIPSNYDFWHHNELDARLHAVTALNALGAPEPPRPRQAYLALDPASASQVNEPAIGRALPVLDAALDQVVQPALTTSTLVLRTSSESTVEKDCPLLEAVLTRSPLARLLLPQLKAGQYPAVWFRGNAGGAVSDWEIKVAIIDEKEALVCLNVRGGTQHQDAGRLEKINECWLVVEWKSSVIHPGSIDGGFF